MNNKKPEVEIEVTWAGTLFAFAIIIALIAPWVSPLPVAGKLGFDALFCLGAAAVAAVANS